MCPCNLSFHTSPHILTLQPPLTCPLHPLQHPLAAASSGRTQPRGGSLVKPGGWVCGAVVSILSYSRVSFCLCLCYHTTDVGTVPLELCPYFNWPVMEPRPEGTAACIQSATWSLALLLLLWDKRVWNNHWCTVQWSNVKFDIVNRGQVMVLKG